MHFLECKLVNFDQLLLLLEAILASNDTLILVVYAQIINDREKKNQLLMAIGVTGSHTCRLASFL